MTNETRQRILEAVDANHAAETPVSVAELAASLNVVVRTIYDACADTRQKVAAPRRAPKSGTLYARKRHGRNGDREFAVGQMILRHLGAARDTALAYAVVDGRLIISRIK